MREVPGSIPGAPHVDASLLRRALLRPNTSHAASLEGPRGVTVSTLDSESSDRGSNPREVSRQMLKTELKRECNIVFDNTIAFASMRPYAKSYPSQPMGTVC